MSFQERLEALRAKPEHVRTRYAFWSAFGITAVIFAFWLGSFPAFGNVSQNTVTAAVNKVGTPAQSLVASVGSLAGDLKDLIFGARKVTYTSTVIVKPGKSAK